MSVYERTEHRVGVEDAGKVVIIGPILLSKKRVRKRNSVSVKEWHMKIVELFLSVVFASDKVILVIRNKWPQLIIRNSRIAAEEFPLFFHCSLDAWFKGLRVARCAYDHFWSQILSDH